MIFRETPLKGAYIIEIDRQEDVRGFFARTFCREEMTSHGLTGDFAQCNTSFNIARGTLRGLHFQREPYAEAKLVRCTRGRAWDVMVDLRPESRTYRKWLGTEISAATERMVYIPEGFAHGFQTLDEDTELFYQMSRAYVPAATAGFRWDDPTFAIQWPIADPLMSDRDRTLPLFDPPEIAAPEPRLRTG